jgi:galactokinase
VRAFGPGRVNLIGEHTDYNDGLSLPFAIHLGVSVRAAPLGGEEVEVVAADLGESDRFALAAPAPATGWRAFARGIVAELTAAGHELVPARLEITSDLPAGSGLSSSAALEAALCLSLLAVAGEPEPDRLELARLCSRVENRWAGAPTGLLDQMACLLCRPGSALRIDFSSLSTQDIPLELGGWKLAVAASGETHGAGYAQRRSECERARRLLGLESLSRADAADLARLPAGLRARARHVLEENARVEAAVAAARGGDWPALARLLDESHASLRDLYQSSTAAVEATVAGLKAAGAAGARMIGAGFGGHVLALFPPRTALPRGALAVTPGAGARVLQP